MSKRFTFLLFCLAAVEMLLRLSGTVQTYHEEVGGRHFSYYGMRHASWFLTRESGQSYTSSQPEFTYSYQVNSQGFRDAEWVREKPDSVSRLFVLGDSFVEGDGVPFGEAVTDHLQSLFDSSSSVLRSGCQWDVRNAGMSGSDVWYVRMLVEHLLVEFDHDAVLVVVNDSDLDDYLFRGGMERFLPDTTTRYREGPWWRALYNFHFFRILVRSVGIFSERLLTDEKRLELYSIALGEMVNAIDEMSQICMERGIRFMVIVHPLPYEISSSQSKGSSAIRLLCSKLDSLGVPYSDLHQSLARSLGHLPLNSYGWPINCHFNKIGYEAMAKAIFEEVEEAHPGFFCPRTGPDRHAND